MCAYGENTCVRTERTHVCVARVSVGIMKRERDCASAAQRKRKRERQSAREAMREMERLRVKRCESASTDTHTHNTWTDLDECIRHQSHTLSSRDGLGLSRDGMQRLARTNPLQRVTSQEQEPCKASGQSIKAREQSGKAHEQSLAKRLIKEMPLPPSRDALENTTTGIHKHNCRHTERSKPLGLTNLFLLKTRPRS
jgi:hypothetical protein